MDFFVSELPTLYPVPFQYWHSLLSVDSSLASLSILDTARDNASNQVYQTLVVNGLNISGSDGTTVYASGTLLLAQYDTDGTLLSLYSLGVVPSGAKIGIHEGALYLNCSVATDSSTSELNLFKIALGTIAVVWGRKQTAPYRLIAGNIAAGTNGIYASFRYTDSVSATKTYAYGVAKYDSSGTFGWRTSYKNATVEYIPVDIAISSTGEIGVLVSFATGPTSVLTKLSTAGALLGSVTVASTNAAALASDSAGGFYVLCTTTATYRTPVLVRFTSTLTVAWKIKLSKTSVNIDAVGIAAKTGGVFVYTYAATYNTLSRFAEADGSVVWRNKMSSASSVGRLIVGTDKIYVSGNNACWLTALPDNGSRLGTYGTLVYEADTTYSSSTSTQTVGTHTNTVDTTVYTETSASTTLTNGLYSPAPITYTKSTLNAPQGNSFYPAPSFWCFDNAGSLYMVTAGGAVIKFTSAGNIVWQTAVPSATCVAVDNLGYVYVGTLNITVDSNGGNSCLLLKLSATDGTVVFKKLVNEQWPRMQAIIYDSGYLYITGSMLHDWSSTGGIEHVLGYWKFDAATGSLIWRLGAGGSGKRSGSQSWVNTYCMASAITLVGTNLIAAGGNPAYATSYGSTLIVAIASTSGTGITTFLLRAGGTGDAYAIGGTISMQNAVLIGTTTIIAFKTTPTNNDVNSMRNGLIALDGSGNILWCRIWNPKLDYYFNNDGGYTFVDSAYPTQVCFGGHGYFARFQASDGTFISASITPTGLPFYKGSKLGLTSLTAGTVLLDAGVMPAKTLVFETATTMTLNKETPELNYFNFIGAPIDYNSAIEGTVQDYTGTDIVTTSLSVTPVTDSMNITQTLVGF